MEAMRAALAPSGLREARRQRRAEANRSYGRWWRSADVKREVPLAVRTPIDSDSSARVA